MAFARKSELPALQSRRPMKTAKKLRRSKRVNYYLHWAYPTAVIVALVFIVTIYLCQCTSLISEQYNITQLKEQKKILAKEQKTTQLAIEDLKSLERVDKIARKQLGMVDPVQRISLNLTDITRTAQLAQTGDMTTSQ